jgi:hypothetical protein
MRAQAPRRVYLLAGAILCQLIVASNARSDDTPSLNSLVTPDSPAFVILGVSPTAIQRPTTPKALATSLLSAFSSTGQTLVPNYALEVAPYWLESHPQTTWAEVAKNSFATPLQTLTLSFATSSSSSPTSLSTAMSGSTTQVVSPGAPKAALGLRTTIHQGTVNPKSLKTCTDGLAAQAASTATTLWQRENDWGLARKAQILETWGDAWAEGWKAAHIGQAPPLTPPSPPSPPNGVFPPTLTLPPDATSSTWNIANVQAAFGTAWNGAWASGYQKGWTDGTGSPASRPPTLPSAPPAPALPSDTMQTMTQSSATTAPSGVTQGCAKAASSREGLVIDAALAAAFAFPNGNVDDGKLSTYALWTTVSFLSTYLSALGLVKFMQDNLDISGQHTLSLDVGGRGILALSRFGLSAEGVYRIPLDSNTSKDQYRVDLGADVELVTGYWFSVAGGHDFIDGSDWSQFFAMANFKGTFGSSPTIVTSPATGAQ